MQTPQQVIDAKIARTREIPDDNSEVRTTLFSRRLAAEKPLAAMPEPFRSRMLAERGKL